MKDSLTVKADKIWLGQGFFSKELFEAFIGVDP
jgi:hypothetical protein